MIVENNPTAINNDNETSTQKQARQTPRLDAYDRMLKRLYESALIIQQTSSPRQPHVIINHDSLSGPATQRRFLKALAFLIDVEKGGSTTTAIALEETDEHWNFTVAINDQAQTRRAVSILNQTLAQLVDLLTLPREQRNQSGDAMLLRRHVHHARARIRKEAKLLAATASRCIKHLQVAEVMDGECVIEFLGRFTAQPSGDLTANCLVAYEAQHHPMLQTAARLGRDPEDGSRAGSETVDFKKLPHYVRRLAAHVRTITQVIDDGRRLRWLLDTYRVTAVRPSIPAPRPQADIHTTLRGILKRLLPAGDERFDMMLVHLERINGQSGLEACIQDRLSLAKREKSVIHCEVQVLEHFYHNKLRFAGNDPFVGCSKPSCLCCRLYFQHHPLQCAQVDAHNRLYINWAPKLLPDGVKDQEWKVQRHVLGEIAHELGNLAVRGLERVGICRHDSVNFDSLDGCTVSWDGHVELYDSCSEIDSEDSDEPGGALL